MRRGLVEVAHMPMLETASMPSEWDGYAGTNVLFESTVHDRFSDGADGVGAVARAPAL